MKGRISVIGGERFVLGFKATGITRGYVCRGEEAKQKLRELCEDEEMAIVVVAESVAEGMMEDIEEISSTRFLPAIIVIEDDVSQKNLGGMSIERYIERATGISALREE